MQKHSKRIAIITGASSGMGREFAKQLEQHFSNIDEFWLIARRKERLEELQEELNRPCLLIPMDITSTEFFQYFQNKLSSERVRVLFLINCAGYGMLGPVAEADFETSIGMVNTNSMGLTAVTRLALPYMMKNSRIINLASSAAFLPQMGFSIYAASKSYVLSFSRSLARELKHRQIYVTAVCPGPVDTEFFDIAEQASKRPWYKDWFMANCSDVVETALKDSKEKRELSIYGMSMKIFYIATKLFPHAYILNVMQLFSKNK